MQIRHGKKFDIHRAILVALPCLFFLPELLGISQFAGWDVTRLNLPLKWFDVMSIRDGAMPLWNPYLYAGMPQLAESESGLFYPGNWLLYLPGNFFWWAGIVYILHFIMAGLFMDLWLRGRGINKTASFFGAVLFQTAPFLLFHVTSMALLQSIVWFPLLLWLTDRYAGTAVRAPEAAATKAVDYVTTAGSGRKEVIYIFLLIFLLGGLLMLIGSVQMAFYQGFLLFFYLIGYIITDKTKIQDRLLKSIAVIIALAIGAILIGAIIWIPAREFASETVRESAGRAFYYLGSNWLNPIRLASIFYFPAYGRPTEVVGWASSLIYVGLLPTIFAMLRLAGIRVNWKRDAPLIIMGAVALILAFGMYNPINQLLITFPPFSMFRYQGRLALGVFVPLIALGSMFISDRMKIALSENGDRQPADLRKALMWSIGIALILVAAFLITASRSKAILYGGIILIIDIALTWWIYRTFMRSGQQKKFTLWITVYLLFHLIIVFPVGRLATMYRENFENALGFFDTIQRDDGQTPRLLVTDVGRFADRDILAFNRWTPQTSLPNLCAGNTAVFENVQTMDPYTPLRPTAWNRIIRDEIATGFQNSDKSGILDPVTSAKLEFLGIDAIVTSGNVSQIRNYHLATDVDLSGIFGENAKLFLADTMQPRVYDLALTESGKPGSGTIQYTRNAATIGVSARSATTIVEISYDPNWAVTVNDQPTMVSPYQDVFCMINAGPGEHVIEFTYHPKSVTIGGYITITGIIIAIFLCLGAFVVKKEKGKINN